MKNSRDLAELRADVRDQQGASDGWRNGGNDDEKQP